MHDPSSLGEHAYRLRLCAEDAERNQRDPDHEDYVNDACLNSQCPSFAWLSGRVGTERSLNLTPQPKGKANAQRDTDRLGNSGHAPRMPDRGRASADRSSYVCQGSFRRCWHTSDGPLGCEGKLL